jgi:DNA-binding NarL/FixJ family response regulator
VDTDFDCSQEFGELVGSMGVARIAKVAIVDSQPIYRAGVGRVLRDLGSMMVVAEGDTATDALGIIKRSSVDILLLDTDVAGGWKQTLASISGIAPSTRTVILSSFASEENASGALQLGARGFLLKQVGCEDLVSALRAIERGNLYVTPTLAAQLIARTAPQEIVKPAGANAKALTPREFEIIAQIAVGATNKEVARQLNISEKTVKHYMTIIMHKLQVRNRVEAVLAIRGVQSSAA